MRIDIAAHVANDPDAHGWLDRILHKIDDGWHVWDTGDLPNPGAMMDSSWFLDRGSKGAWVIESFVASIQRDAWTFEPHGRAVRVTANPHASDELNPEDACRLAEEPLYILVENRNSDGAFVNRVVKELDDSLQRTWNQPGYPIRFDSVGGKGEMHKEIQRRTGRTRYRPRLVVIIDSDRKAPSDNPSRDAIRLHRICEQLGVPCWILAKREAENYLPRTLLIARPDTGADHRQRVEAWDRLTDEQKDFFDMKDGLRTTESLFAGLSATDQATLSIGFGSNVHVCWTLSTDSVKEELIIRGQGDLERGINLIRSEV